MTSFYLQPQSYWLSSCAGPRFTPNDCVTFTLRYQYLSKRVNWSKKLDRFEIFLSKQSNLSWLYRCDIWLMILIWQESKVFRTLNEYLYYISGFLYYLSATVNPVLYNLVRFFFRLQKIRIWFEIHKTFKLNF